MKCFLSWLLILCMMITIFSCGNNQCCTTKSIACMGYNDAVGRSWIPYTGSGSLIFLNNVGQLDTITYDNVSITAPYTSQKACNSVCDAVLQVSGNGSTYSLSCMHQLPQQNGSGISNTGLVIFKVLNTNVLADSIAPNGLINVKVGSCQAATSFSPQLVLNGTNFSNVQQITIDTSATCGTSNLQLRNVWLARNRGLVGYETFADNKVWVLQ